MIQRSSAQRPLRIAMVIPYDPYYQPFVIRSLRFAEELVLRGHRVQYIHNTARAANRGTRVREQLPAGVEAQACNWNSPRDFARLARAVAESDVVHFQKVKPPHAWAALAAARVFDKPLHQDWDDDEGAFWAQTLRDRAQSMSLTRPASLAATAEAAVVTAVSGASQWLVPKLVDTIGGATMELRRKSELWGADKSAIFPARVGVDTHVFTPARRDQALRERLKLTGPTVLYAGSFDVRPDLDFFVHALKALVATLPSARCLVLGGGFGRSHFIERLEQAGLRQHVVLSDGLIPFEEMPKYVASCDVAALPFRNNAINRAKSSLTLLECMASGLAVVTHDVGDIGWMLGGGGELAKEDDPVDFAARIARLLSQSSERQALADAGRRRAESAFGWSGSVDYLEKAYRHAIANHARKHQRGSLLIAHREEARS